MAIGHMEYEGGVLTTTSTPSGGVSVPSTEVTTSNATTVLSQTVETGATYILTTSGQFNAAITSAQVAVYLTGAVSTQKRAVMHGLGDFMLSQVFKASTNNIDMKIAQNSGSARIASATISLYKLQD